MALWIHKLAGAIRWRGCSAVRVVLSTVHPAKFSKIFIKALSTSHGFGCERDVLLLKMERRVVRRCRRTNNELLIR